MPIAVTEGRGAALVFRSRFIASSFHARASTSGRARFGAALDEVAAADAWYSVSTCGYDAREQGNACAAAHLGGSAERRDRTWR
ncbi:hypothetical protein COLSTE_00135 [Collinsella stercoris DSM 13279]|uniref:Uncharacterized protein n=1 Tax=Collinsella stercoris DSM 13279 TaxID=445975 RepID=B6G7V4_9ACTN|nr:hypothetical protein COLSTE_00135 [Collinsella stercoris DSM 13279]